jgi:dTDP-4-dehydrorhamnose 3,5-epimerase
VSAGGVTTDWLRSLSYNLPKSGREPIAGALVRHLNPIVDGRGDVTELWSLPWERDGILQPTHVYQSATDFGVVKAWHLHEVHTDQFVVTRGKLQVSLVDIREDSPTFCDVNVFIMSALKPFLLQIPPGIMHGWKALSPPEVLVINFQSHVYDPTDEYKFPWDCVLGDVWEPRNG